MSDLLNDDDIRRALEPYRQVRASDGLRAAATRPPSPTPRPAASWAHRHPRVAVAGAAAALAAVVAVVALLMDGPRPVDTQTVAGSPDISDAQTPEETLDISDAETVVFADGATVPVDELFDAANHERLRALFAEHGAELVVIELPVAPAADGRVYAVSVPMGMADESQPELIHLDAGGRVEVEVGRADEAAGTEGLTLYEVFPEVEGAIDRDDPVATGEALGALGFQVEWVLIEAAGEGHGVETPPPGTVVVSVLGPNGEWNSNIDPSTDTLMVELASPDVAEDLGH